MSAEKGAPAIVVADDEPHIRLLIELSLEPLTFDGARVVAVADGPAALAAIRHERAAVAVLDLMLPGMSGIDVCRVVKSDESTAGCHIVILTARGQEVDRQRGQEAGADAYMTKPFDPDELLEIVRTAIGGQYAIGGQ
jgi:DNA-binding response OmpR family regulator